MRSVILALSLLASVPTYAQTAPANEPVGALVDGQVQSPETPPVAAPAVTVVPVATTAIAPAPNSMIGWLVGRGGDALLWVLTLVGSWVLVLVQRHLTGRAIVQRALTEVGHAVLEVSQTFVSGLKAGAADGKLTLDDARKARDMAVTIARANIGPKGLEALGRIIGVDVGDWLKTRVESTVAQIKMPVAVAPVALPFPKP